MASDYYFYEDGDDIGIVVKDESSSDVYSVCDEAATLKLFGRFQQDDISTDSSSYSLINSRYHIAIAYRVLAELIPKKASFYMSLYNKMVRNIRMNTANRLNHKRRIRNYYY